MAKVQFNILQIDGHTDGHTYGPLDEHIDIQTDTNCIEINNFVTELFFFCNIRLSGNLQDDRHNQSAGYPVFG